ncbi:hypothetical protein H310_04123 [Aphanomyces invadans]|uniref:Uncharacterized protein n=1 Tax=Aphanomyces invadans TaxID=157072 RepID=A0A024UFW9_9STRA|nr:hypothetical protein H310_04123 [Aphanomyces invadans]ETW05095.1 hypothetical protein H310_04123 [Aphanomyces invadans]|eukprot:XP_008866533.1 hypothetical protein H310_04123 [Aphanomyces invadans]
MCACDDAKEDEIRRLEESKKSQDHDDRLGVVVRDDAMRSMGKRKIDGDDHSGTSGGGKVIKLMALMHDQIQSELDFQKEKFDAELVERRKDRELVAEQFRQQQETMAKLLDMLIKKS